MAHSRRSFVAYAGAATIAAAFPLPWIRRRPAWDVVVRGGSVFDGTGAAAVEADVAIDAGRIVSVGPRLAGAGAEEIDARGLAVAPGFIDIHSHADGTLFDDPMAESVVRQGVTTVVVGQDGGSRAPRRAEPAAGDERARLFPRMRDLLSEIDRLRPAVNVASMVGLGTVRSVVIGNENRPATVQEIEHMTRLVREALADGACGASSGLEYTPGAFASLDELVAVCRPLASRRLPYASHMRNEDDRLLEAIEEAIAVARGAGCPLQVSHLKTQGTRNWSKIDAALERIERARSAGVDTAFDRYPYTAYQTGLANLFPAESRSGGGEAFLARLTAGDSASALRAACLAKVESIGGWDHVMLTSVAAEEDKAAEGQRLGAYAAALGADPYELTVALLTRSRGAVGMVGFAMSEENLERFLAHPLGMVCSDGGAWAVAGPARRGHPHPRGLGTFPRVLGHYVRERGVLSLAQAVHKMSGLPAARLRLRDRGKVATGAAGDLVVFDPSTVSDRATFTEPFQYPVGIGPVLVNGAVALRDGRRSSPAGRALRAG